VRADQGEAAQSPEDVLSSARTVPPSVGTLALSSIGLSTARQVSIAGMTQPISAQAIGPPARLIWRLS
jgi:hypothetical protein